MNKRLLTAAIGVALCALAAPAKPEPHMYDDDGSRTYRQRDYDRSERSYDRDDDEARSYRRERRQHQRATRQRKSTQAARKTHSPASREAPAAGGGDAAPADRQARPAGRRHARCHQAGAAAPGQERRPRLPEAGCAGPARSHRGPVRPHAADLDLPAGRPHRRHRGASPSMPRGEAIDFNAGGRKGAVVRWLIANHKSGGTMTYAGMSHIHVDVGQHFVALNSGGGR